MQNTQFEYFKIEADESDETPKLKRQLCTKLGVLKGK